LLQGGCEIPELKSVTIGTSTGGLNVLHEIIPRFSKMDSYVIFIVQHITPEVEDPLIDQLDERSSISVKKAEHGMHIEPGNAYFLPADYHASVEEQSGEVTIKLYEGPRVNFVRPSIDVFMKSVAELFRENAIGVLLTGMGRDGAQGMKTIKDAGGTTIAQNEETAPIFRMPSSAIMLGCVDKVLPLQEIFEEIMDIINQKGGT
jgi:two-component system chemotaxis response regulator CheB